ncbi:MAG: bifunctional 5,10-methylenetetrahydrofolate dehydrogenase/5,10-methenyltetrahydrofolate cyclohydrolase [Coriobacteriales bacterium]|jgi:methylenetetrahydrofolate dehydrogenase (NADP+)/methenyltetrahydrofolate cyclohydrolase
MATILDGTAVASSINENLHARSDALREMGIAPTLAILRVGERDDDVAYEISAGKRARLCGVDVQTKVLPDDCTQARIEKALAELNEDPAVHGILILSPLPKSLDEKALIAMMKPSKDMDGVTARSIARSFLHVGEGYPPCTAQACIELLDHYGINVCGKNVAIIGRSPVVGRPLAAMLIDRHATVTICHTRTVDTPSITRRADILVVAAGQPEMVTADYVSPGQVVVDVGITWNEERQKLCGDVLFEEVEPVVDMITPVPGGVGSVTTSVLIEHVVDAAEASATKQFSEKR